MTKTNRRDIGALWKRQSKKDNSIFLYGRIELDGKTIEFRAYKNDYKKPGDKTPDYRIYPVVNNLTNTTPTQIPNTTKETPTTEDPLI